MLNRIELLLSTEDKLHVNMGSAFHGWILEQIEREYGDRLHAAALKPFSQYLRNNRQNGQYSLCFQSLNTEAKEKIVESIKDKKEIHLKEKGIVAKIEAVEVWPETSYNALTERYYLNVKPQRYMTIALQSPTSFSVAKHYLNYPSIFHIYQSLINRWNAFSTTIKITDETVLKHLVDYTHLSDYRLQTQVYTVGGGKIKGFSGTMTLCVKGPETMVNLANLLFAFSNYSGIGIKTALGMGGTKVEI